MGQFKIPDAIIRLEMSAEAFVYCSRFVFGHKFGEQLSVFGINCHYLKKLGSLPQFKLNENE